MIKDKDLNEAVNRIIDCIACADGGTTFIRFLQGLNFLQEEKEQGSEGAASCIEVVYTFDRLIKALTND